MNRCAYYPKERVEIGGIFDALIPSKRKKLEAEAKEKAQDRLSKMEDAASRIEAAKQEVLDAAQSPAPDDSTPRYLVMAGVAVGAVILGILFFGRQP